MLYRLTNFCSTVIKPFYREERPEDQMTAQREEEEFPNHQTREESVAAIDEQREHIQRPNNQESTTVKKSTAAKMPVVEIPMPCTTRLVVEIPAYCTTRPVVEIPVR
jgi:hypothetical protein